MGLRSPGLGSNPGFHQLADLEPVTYLPEHQFIHLQNGDSTVPVMASPRFCRDWWEAGPFPSPCASVNT